MQRMKTPARSRTAAVSWLAWVFAGAVASAPADAAPPKNVWRQSSPVVTASAPSAPQGALVTYQSLTDFLNATASLELESEDFEGGFTPPNGMRVCFQAVASTADDPCFAPGQLIPGFGIRSSGGNIWDPTTGVDSDLVVLGPGARGIASTVIGANVPDPPTNPTELTFDDPRTAVAMDVYDGLGGQPVQIEAYDASDQLIGIFTVMPPSASLPAFAGFTSSIPVKRVAVNALASGSGELIDNLYFGGGAGHLKLDPAAPDFDALALGDAATVPVTVTNDGGVSLPIGAIAAPPAPFSIATDSCSNTTLAAGASCTVEIAFTPEWASEFSASLDIDAARLDLRGEGVRARLSPIPGAIDFGTVGVGGAPGSATLTLANRTGGALDVTSIGSATAPFARTGGSCAATPFSLPAGQACTLELSFTPTFTGAFDAAVTVTGSGLPATTTVNLHGIGG